MLGAIAAGCRLGYEQMNNAALAKPQELPGFKKRSRFDWVMGGQRAGNNALADVGLRLSAAAAVVPTLGANVRSGPATGRGADQAHLHLAGPPSGVPEVRDCTQLRLGSLRVMLWRRPRPRDRPVDNAPMNRELRRHTRDRTDTQLVLPTELPGRIHRGVSVHKRPPDPIGVTVG
jgi:hypothetical protein